jgi:hypothetical protein
LGPNWFVDCEKKKKKRSFQIYLAIGEVTKRQRDSIQSKRKVVKMLIAVVLIFGICW